LIWWVLIGVDKKISYFPFEFLERVIV